MRRSRVTAVWLVSGLLALSRISSGEISYLTNGGPYERLIAPKSVSTDARGTLYVLDYNGIHLYAPSGRHIGMFGNGGRATVRQGSTAAIAVSKEQLLVLDVRGLIYEYDLNGNPRGTRGTANQSFRDNLGRIFVFDPETHQVSVTGANFQFANKINEVPGHLVDPRAAVARPNGFLYVADGAAQRVLTFDSIGHHVDRLRSHFQNPRDLTLSGDLLFVLDDLSDQIDASFVKVFNRDDRLIAEFGRPGMDVPNAGRVDLASSLAASRDFLFVCDQAQNRVVRVPISAFLPGAHEPGVIYHRVDRQRSGGADHAYKIRVDSTLGPSNTARIEGVTLGATRTPRFQPNVSLTVENTSKVAVRNPRVVVKGGPNWFSGRDLAEQITHGCQTDEEKAFAAWNFVRRYMLPGISWPDYFDAPGNQRSVTRFFNAFGSGACGSYHWLLPRLAMLAGLRAASGQLSDGSHGVAQIEYDGKGRYFDSLLVHSTDRRTPIGLFFRLLDNRSLASYEELVHDHYLANRAGENVGMLSQLFGYHDGWDKFTMDYRDPANMGMLLRPGESITRRWDYLGQYVGKEKPTDAITNGEVVYRPRLADASYRPYVVSEEGLASTADDGISPALHVAKNNSRDGTTVFKVSSPYPIVGGSISGVFKRTGENDRIRLMASYDGHQWFPLWRMEDFGVRRENIGFSHLEGLRRLPLRYEIYMRVQIGTSGPLDWVGVDELTLQVVFQAYSPSLPALDVGINEIRYIDETTEPHEVTIEHHWKESSVVTPPGPPPAPVFPPNGARHHGFDFVFKWQPAPPGSAPIDAYEFSLSDRKDMAWPLTPNFESFASGLELRVPESSYFSPGGTYYWRVRAVDERGVHGSWSPVWMFQVDGPGRPINLKQEIDGRRIHISWTPDPHGTRPVRYEVYASDERGFTPSDHPYLGIDRALEPDGKYPTLPANLLASTDKLRMTVVDESNANPLSNRTFYRVRAIDAEGVRSTPSEYLEIPHPFIYSAPNTSARIGAAYSYQVKTTWSMGDAQWNRVPPKPQGVSFLFADHLVFKLVKAPIWLSIDESKGLLRGTPPSNAAGSHEVSVEVTAFDTSPDDKPKVRSKSAQHFVLTVSP